MTRKAGVLLPISSLPGEYGIGDFGRSATFFADFIADLGFKIWQILPIGMLGPGNSPYSGGSAFAGNYLFIDLESLPERLLNDSEKTSAKLASTYKVDYFGVRNNKGRLLKLAYSRLNADDFAAIEAFKKSNSWLEDYALYMAIRDEKGTEWENWEEPLRLREKTAIAAAKDRLKAAVGYYEFEQYLFYTQWAALKKAVNARGIEIFGDMPIYVSYNSPDVWAHHENFLLDKDRKPEKVAGVPPDYFSPEGQLWGNPLYNYKYMEKHGYNWFITRILHNLELYDMLRIDHFRGFYEYWAVPSEAESAKEGAWEKGPQMKLWKELKKQKPDAKIVAEDLGIIDDGVRNYLQETGFPGMRVLQFAFDGSKDNPHLPYNYDKNIVAYTATHDNDTSLGWLYSLPGGARDDVLDFIGVGAFEWGAGGKHCKSTQAMIKAIAVSSADTAIFPLQDLTGYGSDTRINIPGVPDGNWEYRITLSTLEDIDSEFIRKTLNRFGRV